METKYLGHSLIAIGILTILFAGFSVYMVFTGKSTAYPLFNFPPIGFGADQLLNTENIPPQLVSKEQVELVSSDLLNDTTNVIFHMMLMGFIASIGAKIAGIGTKLVRPINVKLQEAK
jgi:hypothetical protein